MTKIQELHSRVEKALDRLGEFIDAWEGEDAWQGHVAPPRDASSRLLGDGLDALDTLSRLAGGLAANEQAISLRFATLLELAEEQAVYVPDYFSDKWGLAERLADLRKEP